jgi:hypothetical protein
VSWRKAGKAAGGALLDSVREWIAVLGGLGSGLSAGLLIWQGRAGSVPGNVCLVVAAGAFVAAFFGMRDPDAGGWTGALVAILLGLGAFVAFGLAA